MEQINLDQSEMPPGALFKIGIFGIENAGKTSILRVLQRQFAELSSLKPTIKVEHSFLEVLGNNVLVWDYGGQEKYRTHYLENPERYFAELDIVFYVIDIQDPDMLGSNIMYFEGLFHRVMKHSPQARFVLLFHKLDPEMELPQNALAVQKRFMDAIGYVFEENNVPYQTFRTSIYNPLSIIKAFSQALIPPDKITESISKILEVFCTDNKLLFASVLTENFFELGYYAVEGLSERYPNSMEAIFNDIFRNLENWRNPEITPKSQFGSIGLLHKLYAYQKGNETYPIFIFAGFDDTMEQSIEALKRKFDDVTEELLKVLEGVDFTKLLKEGS